MVLNVVLLGLEELISSQIVFLVMVFFIDCVGKYIFSIKIASVFVKLGHTEILTVGWNIGTINGG